MKLDILFFKIIPVVIAFACIGASSSKGEEHRQEGSNAEQESFSLQKATKGENDSMTQAVENKPAISYIVKDVDQENFQEKSTTILNIVIGTGTYYFQTNDQVRRGLNGSRPLNKNDISFFGIEWGDRGARNLLYSLKVVGITSENDLKEDYEHEEVNITNTIFSLQPFPYRSPGDYWNFGWEFGVGNATYTFSTERYGKEETRFSTEGNCFLFGAVLDNYAEESLFSVKFALNYFLTNFPDKLKTPDGNEYDVDASGISVTVAAIFSFNL